MPSPSLTLLRTQSDERLTELARAGHERAFEAIVERYRRPLLRAARRVLPEGRAEDALQQALLSAWTALQRGDEVRELRPWLYRVVHNTSLNTLRMSGYDYAELTEAIRIAGGSDDDELERRAVVRQTLASLAALPERQREALLRTALSGESQEDVARDLGLSGNALRQLVHRARVSMRAAATALTPLPLVTAAASGSARGGPLVERIAEVAAGGGASVTLAKAGTVVVLAGSALSGPAVVERVTDRPAASPEAAAAAPSREPRSAASEAPEPVAAPVQRSVAVRGRPAPGRRSSRAGSGDDRSRDGRKGHSGSGGREPDDDDSDSSGPGREGSEADDDDDSGSGRSGPGEDEGDDDSSGPGGSGSGRSGPSDDEPDDDSSGSDDDDSDDSSGSGSGSGDPVEPLPVPTIAPTAEPDDDESHEGPG